MNYTTKFDPIRNLIYFLIRILNGNNPLDVKVEEVVNYIEHNFTVKVQAPTGREINPEVQALANHYAAHDQYVLWEARNNRKINAIKRVREMTGCGLREAKDAVEGLDLNAPDNTNYRTVASYLS